MKLAWPETSLGLMVGLAAWRMALLELGMGAS